MQQQVTRIDKVITEADMTREDVEQLILSHVFMGYGTATFDWNEQTGSVRIQHTQETVKGS